MKPSLLPILRKSIKDCSPDATCHYLHRNSNGDIIKNINDICFARLRNDGGGISDIRFYINQILKNCWGFHTDEQGDKAKKHVEWLVRESHLAPMFRNKKTFWENGLIIDCKYPLMQIFYAMTLIRNVWEWNRLGYINHIEMLVEEGFSRIHAAIIAQYLYKEDDNWKIAAWVGSHGVSCAGLTVEGLKKYSLEMFSHLPPANKDAQSFSGLYSAFIDLQRKGESITSILAAGRKEVGEGWNVRSRIIDEQFKINVTKLKEALYA